MFANQLSLRVRVTFLAPILLLALVLAFSFLWGNASAALPVTPAKAQPSSTCEPGWFVVSSPNPPSGASWLNGITVARADDVWAVGGTTGAITSTLIEHWDGTAWNIVSSPNPGASDNVLNGVDALTANDIWAVGASDSQALLLHWNGTQWAVVPGPALGEASTITSVSVISPNDAWAVGYGQNNSESTEIILHWDGVQWNSVQAPGTFPHDLYGVDGIASNDVWAVGAETILHWDGTNWSVVQVPDLPVQYECLNPSFWFMLGVSVRASNDVWSVGYCPGRVGNPGASALIFHWDGSQWTFYSPDLGFSHLPILTAVDAVTADDVWSVGYRFGASPANVREGVVLHWDGTQWTRMTSPHPGPGGDQLYSVAAVSHDDVWATGFFRASTSSPGQTLVERYHPCPPPPCPGERFTDVCPGDYFYTATLALADDGIISGYSTAPPCNNSLWIPCFKPYNNVTRGQASKIVSLAANFNDPVTGQTFEDVPPGSTFYTYTERMAERGIIVGYSCGGPFEPCIPPGNRAYFRPGNNLTRGQMAKIVASSFGWFDPPVGQDFEDVLPGSTFYTYTAQLYIRGIVGGYQCGGPGEPCVPPGNLPYYRPNNNVTRGQTAKIVQLARTQPTSTPTTTSTPAGATTTPTPTGTPTNPDCQGILPSVDMQIMPSNCEVMGTTLTFLGNGFLPSEYVNYWWTLPDGTIVGTTRPIQADNSGNVGPLPFTPDPNHWPTGSQSFTLDGATSHHQSIGYFRLLAP